MNPYIHKIKYYETDKMGITHHSNYIRFMEEARVDFMEQLGWGYDKMEAEGIGSPVIGITCDYKKSTTFPDELTIEVKVLKLSALKIVIDYTMTVKGAIACKATSTHCFLDSTGRPVPIEKKYPDFYNKLKEFLIES